MDDRTARSTERSAELTPLLQDIWTGMTTNPGWLIALFAAISALVALLAWIFPRGPRRTTSTDVTYGHRAGRDIVLLDPVARDGATKTTEAKRDPR